MKLLVHDYCGHPFQVQLSRTLAHRGHDVTHAYCASNPTTPNGALLQRSDDPETFRVVPIALPRPIEKGVFIDRWLLEKRYGRKLSSLIRSHGFDAVMLANTPLDASALALRACRSKASPLVYWLQDLVGEASSRILGAKLGVPGQVIGSHYKKMERRILGASAGVIGITEDFRAIVESMGVRPERYTTIPNWAPLDEVKPCPRQNVWSQRQGLNDDFVFLYSGTLGFKHNPGLLLALAKAFADKPNVRIIVNSQGAAADCLRDKAKQTGLTSLRVNPFQPYQAMSEVLGSADVLVCILEPDAGVFSVPSKVLSYHCAGRPLLLSVPSTNLSARIVCEQGTGLVADPGDETGFIAPARRLYENRSLRDDMGAKARRYAERNFDVNAIADRFERVLHAALASAPPDRA